MSSATIYYAIVFSKKANTFAKGKTKAKTILGKFGLKKFAHGKFAHWKIRHLQGLSKKLAEKRKIHK